MTSRVKSVSEIRGLKDSSRQETGNLHFLTKTGKKFHSRRAHLRFTRTIKSDKKRGHDVVLIQDQFLMLGKWMWECCVFVGRVCRRSRETSIGSDRLSNQ